jgi:hypothetical protein
MELYGENDSFMTFEAAGACSKCHYVLPRLVDCAPSYFEKGCVICEKCGESVDLWQAASGRALALKWIPWSLASLGAAQTHTKITAETGKYYQVDLTEYGAPADARILSVSYNGGGGQSGLVTAMEWHGNSSARRPSGTVLRLIGIPLGDGTLPRSGSVGVNALWIRGEESDAWPYLVSAFNAAAAHEFAPSLVFAQSAVEISMMPAIAMRLRRHASQEQVKRFLVDSLTYSYALNIVLPYICGELGIAKLPDLIRSALNRLRKRRNKIIHEGVKAAGISHEDTIEGLSAAAFGFEYMRYALPSLASGETLHK